MSNEEKQKLNEVYEFMQSLKRSSSIPREIDQSFRSRFFANNPVIKATTKSADSEDQAVDESGSASYNVLKEPDDFLETEVEGTVYYIPVFT